VAAPFKHPHPLLDDTAYYAVVLIGHITSLARPSFCLSVPYGLGFLTRKQKHLEKKLALKFTTAGVTSVLIFSSRSGSPESKHSRKWRISDVHAQARLADYAPVGGSGASGGFSTNCKPDPTVVRPSLLSVPKTLSNWTHTCRH